MQKFLFYSSLMLMLLLNTSLFAQLAEQCLTSNGNCEFDNALNNDCYPDWIATHGSPNRAGSSNDAFALFLWSPQDCANYDDFKGEGAALENPLTGCVDLSFTLSSNNQVFEEYWVDIIALQAGDVFIHTASVSDICFLDHYNIPPIPPQATEFPSLRVTGSDLAGGMTVNVMEEVEIPAGTAQLWIRPYGKIEAVMSEVGVGITVSNFCLTECYECPTDEESDGPCLRDDAAFILEADAIPGNFNERLYYPVNYNLYDDLNGNHSWKIYSSDEPEGPFTLLEEIQGDFFERTLANGPIYTVIHTLNYQCGEFCYGDNGCGGCKKLAEKKDNEFLGPICCNIVIPVCDTKSPPNLSCEINSRDINIIDFTWDAVPGTSGYEVDYYNYSPCNGNVTAPNVIVATNSVPKPTELGNCYCVRVRSLYPNGCVSGWSSPFCDNGTTTCEPGPIFPIGDGGFKINGPGNSAVNDKLQLEVFPNPSNGSFNIRFGNLAKENQQMVVRIYDLTGKIVHQESLSIQSQTTTGINWQPGSETPRGVYLLKVAQAGQVSTKRLVLQ